MTELQRLHDTDCTLLMGVLNITEDSFSDGGLWLDPGKARDHGDDMLHAGADIIDIGAESTRPGAKRVSEKDMANIQAALSAEFKKIFTDELQNKGGYAVVTEGACPVDAWAEDDETRDALRALMRAAATTDADAA